MSNRSKRGPGRRRSPAPARTLAVAIGGAGLVLAAPAAALLASPGEAHAAPVVPIGDICGGASPLRLRRARSVQPSHYGVANRCYDPFGLTSTFTNTFLDLADGIPVLNVFIGNGADGTAAHPNGFNDGLFAGSGGNGYSPTTPGANGGNGGHAGFFFGDGGGGGSGADGNAFVAGGNGGNGGNGRRHGPAPPALAPQGPP
jgi:hypothetical protein